LLVLIWLSQFASFAAIVGWGLNESGQLSVPASATNVVSLAAGHAHSVALNGDGTIVVWGDNSGKQVAAKPESRRIRTITASGVYTIASETNYAYVWPPGDLADKPAGLTNIVEVATDAFHATALRGDGTVSSWVKTLYPETMPTSLSNVVAVGPAMAVLAHGSVVNWGRRIGALATFPPDLTNVVAVAGFPPIFLLTTGRSGRRQIRPPASAILLRSEQVQIMSLCALMGA